MTLRAIKLSAHVKPQKSPCLFRKRESTAFSYVRFLGFITAWSDLLGGGASFVSEAKMTPCPHLNSHFYSELQTQQERGDGEREGVRPDEGGEEGGAGRGRGRPKTLMRQSPKELKFHPTCLPSFFQVRSPEALDARGPPQTAARQRSSHRGLQRPRGTAFVPGFSQTPPPHPVPLLPRSEEPDGSVRARRAAPNAGGAPPGGVPGPRTGGERPPPPGLRAEQDEQAGLGALGLFPQRQPWCRDPR